MLGGPSERLSCAEYVEMEQATLVEESKVNFGFRFRATHHTWTWYAGATRPAGKSYVCLGSEQRQDELGVSQVLLSELGPLC